MEHQAKGMTSVAIAAASTTTSNECCMCGDHGLSEELLQCKICHFRSQHRYCSNLYPKAKSYQVCNWCLAQSQDGSSTKEKSNKSLNPLSSRKNGTCEEESNKKTKKRNNSGRKMGSGDNHGRRPTGETTNKSLQLPPTKKQKKLQERLAPTTRKRIISNGELEEKRRRKKEEGLSKSKSNVGIGIRKRDGLRSNGVIRRRYKLLDEVST